MIKQVKDVIARSNATLAQDAIGAVALMMILLGSLHIPGVL